MTALTEQREGLSVREVATGVVDLAVVSNTFSVTRSLGPMARSSIGPCTALASGASLLVSPIVRGVGYLCFIVSVPFSSVGTIITSGLTAVGRAHSIVVATIYFGISFYSTSTGFGH